MNDLEHDLRAALDEQASLAPPPHEPGRAVARARRRRVVTTASGVLGVAAIMVLTIVAARAIRMPDERTPASPSPTTTEVSPVPTPLPEAPVPAQLVHGGTAWGVYVSVSESFDDPALETATADAAALGYEAGVGEIACDQPAAETLGVPPDAFVVAIYFDTRADAEAAAALFDQPPVGIAKVTTFCLD